MLKSLLIALGLLVAAPVYAADCAYDRDTLLALDYAAFDQDMHGGWRPVAAVEGCELTAAGLIHDWRLAHTGLDSDQNRTVTWHEGQLRAAAGDNIGAIPLIAVSEGNPDPAMQDYAAATVAFLERDKTGLVAARDKLATEPKPDGWDAAAADFRTKYGVVLAWPSNLDVVDGLVACFDKPYSQAYDTACRSKPGA